MGEIVQSDSDKLTNKTFEAVGVGLNVFEFAELVEGRAKWLDSPQEVIDFVQDEEDIEDVIIVARGGTTTFLSLALTAGVRGVITLQGAPESHLGIVCREYGIPCAMTVSFEKGVRTSRGEIIPADGVRLQMDVSKRPNAIVSQEVGAPSSEVRSTSADEAGSSEMSEQIRILLEKFGGKVPHGREGDSEMRSGMETKVLYLDDESIERTLSVKEANELVKYLTWNEWDALAARATEGESGLIPRQEYEALGILSAWLRYPGWLEVIDKACGVQGVVDIGARSRTEVGTKINLLHSWAMLTAPSFGRGIALEMGLHEPDYHADDVVKALSIARRLYKGHWGDGGMFTSMRNYSAPLLEQSWVERFKSDRISLEDKEKWSIFQRFNASSELLGFLVHFDNRLGLGDSGPYPLPNGGFVIVRDLFINEAIFPWSDITSELPYAITQAMFFGPNTGLDVKLLDLSTLFTEPANYLPHIEGVAVYSRASYNTPMDQLKTLSLDDMSTLRSKVEEVSNKLYRHIASMDHKEKVLAGSLVYTAGFALPMAREAGVMDELIANHGFLDIHPVAADAYETIVSGVATTMIPRLFLTGAWGVPLAE